LTSLVYSGQDGTSVLPSYTWTYDPLGNMTNSTETLGRIVDSVDYASDSTGQLDQADYSGSTSPVPATENYSYDANGNRQTIPGTSTYTTGPNNELLFDGKFTYEYDAEGNRIARWVQSTANANLGYTAPASGDTEVTFFTWDNRDRLTSVTYQATYGTTDTSATYFYDAFGRWVGEEVNPGTAAEQKTAFAYDGNQIVLEFDGTVDATQGNPPLGASALSHRYLWGPAVDQLMADEQTSGTTSTGTLWALTDNENTVRDLATYQAGSPGTTAVVNHRVFSAYGQLVSQTDPTTACIFGYTGRPSSALTNTSGVTVVVIQQSGFRWYDPATGGWLSEDHIWDGVNLYRYCGDGPANAVDPSGLGFTYYGNPNPPPKLPPLVDWGQQTASQQWSQEPSVGPSQGPPSTPDVSSAPSGATTSDLVEMVEEEQTARQQPRAPQPSLAECLEAPRPEWIRVISQTWWELKEQVELHFSIYWGQVYQAVGERETQLEDQRRAIAAAGAMVAWPLDLVTGGAYGMAVGGLELGDAIARGDRAGAAYSLVEITGGAFSETLTNLFDAVDTAKDLHDACEGEK